MDIVEVGAQGGGGVAPAVTHLSWSGRAVHAHIVKHLLNCFVHSELIVPNLFPLSAPLYLSLLPLHHKKPDVHSVRTCLLTQLNREQKIDAAVDYICGWEVLDGQLIFQSL